MATNKVTNINSHKRSKSKTKSIVTKSALATSMLITSTFGMQAMSDNNSKQTVNVSNSNDSLAVKGAYGSFKNVLSNEAYAATLDGSSVNPTDLKVAALQNAKVVDIQALGADPTGQQDSSEIFHKALGMSVDEPIILDLKDGYYKLDSTHNIEVLGSKGIYIRGNGATVDYLNAKTTNLPEFYAFQLHMKRGDNVGVQIDGVTFDGHRNEQNLFFTFNNTNLNGYGGDVSGFYKTRLAKGILMTHANEIAVSNTTFQNAYGGYSLIAEGYNKVNYDDIRIKNVGGDGQTDSLGMFIYFGGHEGDATVNLNNIQATGKMGDGPQSNSGTGFSNPGDPSYTSWIGVVTGENGSIQSTNPDNWLVDKNTTFNITNSTFDNVETTFHTESMAGNVALNVNNVKSLTKQLSITAGIKGQFKGVFNKMDIKMLPYGRNSTYSSLFSSEFGDDTRYHSGYNANLTDANGGAPLHTNLMTNSKVDFLIRDKTPVGAPGSADVYASLAYGNMVNANFECVQFDNVWNKLYANGGGSIKNSVINLWEKNPNEATYAMIKGDPGAAGSLTSIDSATTINKAGSWDTLDATCATPTFNNFSGTSAPVLDGPMIPAPIGGTPGTVVGSAPVINASNVTLKVGDAFDPAKYATATDAEDGTITNITSDATQVDMSKAGTYPVTYTVKDSNGNTTTKTINVIVEAATTTPTNSAPAFDAPTTKSIKLNEPFDPMAGISANDQEDGSLTNKITVVSNNVDTTRAGSYQVVYSVTDSAGQVTTHTMTVSVENAVAANEAPVINASNKTVKQGSAFDPLAGVTATDKEDGTINLINVTQNDVDTSKPGTYKVIYSVTDSAGQVTTKTIDVIVEATSTTNPTPTPGATTNTKPSIIAEDEYIMEGSTFDPMKNVWAIDKEDVDLTDDVKVKSGSVDTSKPGKYDLTYTVTDSDGNVTDRTVTITVGTDPQKAIDSINAQIKTLQDKNAEQDNRLTQLESKVNDLNGKVTNLENEVTAIKGQIAAINDQIKALQDKQNQLEAQLGDVTKNVDDLKSQAGDTQSQIDALKSQTKDLSDRLTVAEGKIEELTKRVDAQDAKIATLKSTLAKHETAINDLNTKIVNLENRVTVNEKEISDLKNKVSALEKEVSEIKTQIKTLQDKVANLEISDKEFADKMAKLTERVTNLETKYTELEKQVQANTTSIKDLTAKVDSHESKIANLESKVSEIEKEIKVLQDKTTKNENDVKDLQNKVTSLENEVKTIKEQIAKFEKEIITINDQIKVLQTADANQDKEIKSLQDKVSLLENKVSSLEIKITTIEKDIKELKDKPLIIINNNNVNNNGTGSDKDDSTKDDSTKDDSKADDSTKDDSTKDDSVKDDSTKDDSKADDSTKDDSTKDDSKADDSTKDDSTKDDSTVDSTTTPSDSTSSDNTAPSNSTTSDNTSSEVNKSNLPDTGQSSKLALIGLLSLIAIGGTIGYFATRNRKSEK